MIEVTCPEVDRHSERLGEVAGRAGGLDGCADEPRQEHAAGTRQLRGSDVEFAGGGWLPTGCHDFGSTQMLR